MAEAVFYISAALLLHSYILYPVLAWLFANLFGKKYRKEVGLEPKVSVLIAAYNEEKVIRATVEGLLASDYPPEKLEIIVGSDNSSDGTPEIMRDICEKEHRVRFFQSTSRKGKTGILNWISKEATGDVLVLCDSNMLFDKMAIRNLTANFADHRVGGVSGEIHLRKNEMGNQETSYWSFESWLKTQEGKIGKLIGANGGIYAIKRENYFIYPEGHPMNDDFVTCLKILGKGQHFKYDPEAFAHEEPSPSNEDEFKRKRRIQISNLGSLEYLKEFLFPFGSYTAFALWSHKILRWMTPFLFLFVLISSAVQIRMINVHLFITGFTLVSFLLAGLGRLLSKSGVKVVPLLLFYYLYGTLYAFFTGTFGYFSSGKSSTWEPTRR